MTFDGSTMDSSKSRGLNFVPTLVISGPTPAPSPAKRWHMVHCVARNMALPLAKSRLPRPFFTHGVTSSMVQFCPGPFGVGITVGATLALFVVNLSAA